MQGRSSANGANHLHARSLTESAFDIDNFVTLSHAQVHGLLCEFVQFAHRLQCHIAHIESPFYEVA